MNTEKVKELLDTYTDIKDTGFKDGSEEQQAAALLIKEYITSYPALKDDETTTALVLHALTDLTVRDYAMGLTQSDNLDHYAWLWSRLTTVAPDEYRSAPACILSTVVFENNNVETAEGWLGFADKDYPLTQLLRRVYAAGWEPKSFAAMRAELHPKVVESIFQGEAVNA
jgi:hypothetical protein